MSIVFGFLVGLLKFVFGWAVVFAIISFCMSKTEEAEELAGRKNKGEWLSKSEMETLKNWF